MVDASFIITVATFSDIYRNKHAVKIFSCLSAWRIPLYTYHMKLYQLINDQAVDNSWAWKTLCFAIFFLSLLIHRIYTSFLYKLKQNVHIRKKTSFIENDRNCTTIMSMAKLINGEKREPWKTHQWKSHKLYQRTFLYSRWQLFDKELPTFLWTWLQLCFVISKHVNPILLKNGGNVCVVLAFIDVLQQYTHILLHCTKAP